MPIHGPHRDIDGQRWAAWASECSTRPRDSSSHRIGDNGVVEGTRVRKALAQRYMVDYDETQSIGKRYRRQDEVGTPYCITVDFDTLDDQAVTIRNRDTMQQERVGLTQVKAYLAQRLIGA